jgi:hypothetical protein
MLTTTIVLRNMRNNSQEVVLASAFLLVITRSGCLLNITHPDKLLAYHSHPLSYLKL